MFLIACAAALLMLWLLAQPRLTAWRRERIQRQPFPAAWRTILRRRVPYVRALPPDLQLQLKKHIQVFLAEKAFIGCAGLTITDEIRVTVAAQACLLILNRPTDYYPKLRQILVYPSAFLVDRAHTDDAGVHQDRLDELAGESWQMGQVILSWDDTVAGARVTNDAMNVVIHEFAHQLDTEKGYASGAPILSTRARHARWAQVMQHEFDRLQAQAEQGEPTLLDPYGATDPAEFFAVASETFFEQPAELHAQHPALYGELSAFYRVDPRQW